MNIEKIDYCFAVLLIKDRGLTAEAKYFLIRVLFLYEHSFEVNQTVLELEKQIGMSDSVLKKARDLLFKKNYLVSLLDSKTRPSSRKGRPRMGFKLSASFVANLEKIVCDYKSRKQTTWVHAFRVEKVLFWRVEKPKGRSKQLKKNTTRSLRPATRIVLAALYSHADECGAVRGLGLSQLAQLSGMLVDRLESHLDILAESGYILSRVSGVTGRFIFGRSAGAFFLNVFNEDLGGYEDSTVLILMKRNYYDEYTKFFWGERIFLESQEKGHHLFDFDRSDQGSKQVNAAPREALESLENNDVLEHGNVVPKDELQNLKSKLATIKQYFSEQIIFRHVYLNVDSKPNNQISHLCEFLMNNESVFGWAFYFREFKLHEVFRDTPTANFAIFLQYKIHEYASVLLSQYWDGLGFAPMTIPDGLIEKIKLDIYPERLWKSTHDKEKYSLIAVALALFIYRISLEVALLAKSMLMHTFKDKQHISPQLNKASYTILPFYAKEIHANNIAVVIKLPDMFVVHRCVVVNVEGDRDSMQLFFEKEDYPHIRDVSNETLAHFGLKNAEVKGK